jgi:hypothetical protein
MFFPFCLKFLFRRKQLLDDLKDMRTYWFESRSTRSHSVGTRFGRGYGHVVRQSNDGYLSIALTYLLSFLLS